MRHAAEHAVLADPMQCRNRNSHIIERLVWARHASAGVDWNGILALKAAMGGWHGGGGGVMSQVGFGSRGAV